METREGPRPYGVDGRVFPCLESVAMCEIMRTLPIVEDFIAVLNGMRERRENVADGEDAKNDTIRETGLDWWQLPSRGLLRHLQYENWSGGSSSYFGTCIRTLSSWGYARVDFWLHACDAPEAEAMTFQIGKSRNFDHFLNTL